MKKQVLSVFLTVAMVVTMLPTSVLSEETAGEVCSCTAACAAEGLNPDCFVCGAEGATMSDCAFAATVSHADVASTVTAFDTLDEAVAAQNIPLLTDFSAPDAGGDCGREVRHHSWCDLDVCASV